MRKRASVSTGLVALAAAALSSALSSACGDVEPLSTVQDLPAPVPVPRAPAHVRDDHDAPPPDEYDDAPPPDEYDDAPAPVLEDEGCPISVADVERVCDPALGSWVETAARMLEGRISPTATKLPDGRVLIVGGVPDRVDAYGPMVSSAELYDPRTDTFSSTGTLHRPRAYHTASLLQDGSVLVTGGMTENFPDGGFVERGDAERWDPTTGQWTFLGDVLAGPRSHHTADVLTDGRVMLLGGADVARARAIDIVSPTGTTSSSSTRFLPSLPDAAVIDARRSLRTGYVWNTESLYDDVSVAVAVVDRTTGSVQSQHLSHDRFMAHAIASVVVNGEPQALLYGIDPDTAGVGNPYGRPTALLVGVGSERTTAQPPLCWRDYSTSTTLRDGRVLVAGGVALSGTPAGAEVYDPTTDTFASTCPMAHARSNATAVELDDGSVLVVGGATYYGHGRLAERFVPGAR
jgi:hypothetical protein